MSREEVDMIDEIEEGERWLSSFDTPQPSAAAMVRVKQKILREMHGGPASAQSHASHWRWKPWHGVLASAASIALAVFVGTSQPPGRKAIAPVSHPVAGVSSNANLGTYAALDSELSDLESVDLTRASLVDAWDEVWSITDGQSSKVPG